MYALRPYLFLLSLIPALFAGWTMTRADGPVHSVEDENEHPDLDRIRKLVLQGKLLPLATLKANVLKTWPGELIGIRVDQEHGNVIYEFRILRSAGQMTEVEVDAKTGKLVEVENE
ncbi:putative membrane protein YkoI [Rhizobium petrolearium]|uniref:PepSY domain-containing protein n=1 Tax=Neorhizobium petrolearium TaxID=515361 RepID=UPI001AE3AE86|nr:PepSY domain-containing protein [Neorhizobium petrolearium]MBP1847436.1 putative membrane protein YkoI [Neorhizobium petrolearium]